MNFEAHRLKGIYGSEAYLITSGKDAVLVDAGYAVGVESVIKQIDKFLDGRELKYIILTHSHYDHIMGTPAISECFPNAKIYAHPLVAKIIAKPNARKTMEELNQGAAERKNTVAEPGWADKLRVDVDVSGGDIINAGEMKIRIMETPGHTNDSISLYFENEDLAIVSESLGVAPGFPDVVPAFIVSYDDAIKSIGMIRDLDPKYIIMPHGDMISGQNIKIYLDNAKKAADNVRRIVMESYEKGLSLGETIEILSGEYYKGNFKKVQPSDALYANWAPMVTKLIEKEYPESDPKSI